MPIKEHTPSATAAVGPSAAPYTADAGGSTTTTVDAALIEADGYWNNRYITYLTGDNANLSRLITDFVALTDTLTHDAFPNTCDAGDTYVIGGWVNPTNAYTQNNLYATCTTDAGEQSYDYPSFFSGNEAIDKVFVKLKYTYLITGAVAGAAATCLFSVKVYDGSSWTTYQVSNNIFATDTANNALTDTIGDNSNSTVLIDVTSTIDTIAKLNSIQTALLTAITADAGLTPQVKVDLASILVTYHIEGGAYPTGTAQTTRSYPKTKKALDAVDQILSL